MARTKQTPLKRDASSEWIDHRQPSNGSVTQRRTATQPKGANGYTQEDAKERSPSSAPGQSQSQGQAGLTALIVCVIGIYMSFLTWAFLQERITTTNYGTAESPEVFTFSIFLNTVQSSFAASVGYVYLRLTSKSSTTQPVFPSTRIILPLVLIAITSSLASPFGYASLKHVGYITFVLAKSCKLLPVMALHVGLFGKRYPLYKYAVVVMVTVGVCVFTLHHPTGKKSKGKPEITNSTWGLMLLSINLLFDGLTNSTQDYINSTFKPYTGSQMMCAQNLICTVLTTAYLLALPYLASTPLGPLVGLAANSPAVTELQDALTFVSRHPTVGYDVLGFAACGAVGQIFIFYTLSKFSSLLLVTITVTRKMLTMLLSVVWFGHTLNHLQWLGVTLVFGGVGAEAWITRREKMMKDLAKEVKEVVGKEL